LISARSRRRARYGRLANPFDDDPCPVAAFAGFIALHACLLVYLLPGSPAVWANVLPGAWHAGLWIIVWCMVPSWMLRLHDTRPCIGLTKQHDVSAKQSVDLTQSEMPRMQALMCTKYGFCQFW
jgi:hypothetical protein